MVCIEFIVVYSETQWQWMGDSLKKRVRRGQGTRELAKEGRNGVMRENESTGRIKA